MGIFFIFFKKDDAASVPRRLRARKHGGDGDLLKKILLSYFIEYFF